MNAISMRLSDFMPVLAVRQIQACLLLVAEIYKKLLQPCLQSLQEAHDLLLHILTALLEEECAFGQYPRLCRRAAEEVWKTLINAICTIFCTAMCCNAMYIMPFFAMQEACKQQFILHWLQGLV